MWTEKVQQTSHYTNCPVMMWEAASPSLAFPPKDKHQNLNILEGHCRTASQISWEESCDQNKNIWQASVKGTVCHETRADKSWLRVKTNTYSGTMEEEVIQRWEVTRLTKAYSRRKMHAKTQIYTQSQFIDFPFWGFRGGLSSLVRDKWWQTYKHKHKRTHTYLAADPDTELSKPFSGCWHVHWPLHKSLAFHKWVQSAALAQMTGLGLSLPCRQAAPAAALLMSPFN